MSTTIHHIITNYKSKKCVSLVSCETSNLWNLERQTWAAIWLEEISLLAVHSALTRRKYSGVNFCPASCCLSVIVLPVDGRGVCRQLSVLSVGHVYRTRAHGGAKPDVSQGVFSFCVINLGFSQALARWLSSLIFDRIDTNRKITNE